MAQIGVSLSPESSELVERGDLDALTRHVNGLVAAERWSELDVLRERCRQALDRGKQLWAVAAHIEYRMCLEGPSRWAATMLETGTGRFAIGPLPEVAASTHTWSELAPYLNCTPQAAMAAHERVVRGDDLTTDPLAATLPEVLDLPLRLEPWEPAYALAEYHPERMEAHSPGVPALGPVVVRSGTATVGPGTDEVSSALEDLASTWTAESDGRAVAVSVRGDALDAISALGARATQMVELTSSVALATMAWAAANGGAYGRRRGAAPGRFAAWWVVAALGGLTQQYPLSSADVGQALAEVRWYAWGSGEPATGWALRLAVEAASGPGAGRAWAVAAIDAA